MAQVKTKRDNPVKPIKMNSITITGLDDENAPHRGKAVGWKDEI
jgi:hypothetical protein